MEMFLMVAAGVIIINVVLMVRAHRRLATVFRKIASKTAWIPWQSYARRIQRRTAKTNIASVRTIITMASMVEHRLNLSIDFFKEKAYAKA